MSEKILKNIRVYGKTCCGCQRHKRDVMITVQDACDDVDCKFHDMFLTRDQAERLVADIAARLHERDDE